MSTSIKDQILLMTSTDRLEGVQNWRIWRRRVWDTARLCKFDGHLLGTSTRPARIVADPVTGVVEDDSRGEKWDETEHVARCTMTWNMDDADGHGIDDSHTAAQIWTILLDRYEKNDIVSQTALTDRLRMKKYEDGTSLVEHIAELHRRKTLANNAGANITDETFKMIIIQSLPPSWNNISMPLYDLDSSLKVISRLETYELHLSSQRQTPSTRGSVKAYMAPYFPPIAGTPQANLSQHKSDLHCANPIHGAQGLRGHTLQTCYSTGGSMEGQQPGYWRRRNPHPTGSSTVSTANLASSSSIAPADNYVVSFSLFMSSVGTPRDSLQTFIDSGASHHYFSDKAWFTEYVAITPLTVRAAKRGSDFKIIGVGNVHAQCLVNGKYKPLILRNALHAPELSTNLISVSRADRSGMRWCGQNGELHIVDCNNTTIILGILDNENLYEVKLEQLDAGLFPSSPIAMLSVDLRALVASSFSAKASFDTWHRQFAHFSESSVETL